MTRYISLFTFRKFHPPLCISVLVFPARKLGKELLLNSRGRSFEYRQGDAKFGILGIALESCPLFSKGGEEEKWGNKMVRFLAKRNGDTKRTDGWSATFISRRVAQFISASLVNGTGHKQNSSPDRDV